ncbi:MAG: UDP-N-acetylglucosamine 2-epimerase (hydrolyzing) [Bacteroidales bacterium]|nr:UDP-N-acetylglucosamine 2-epimerase (hydrolyzing) [Bacteroidales bacterium]
MKKIIALFSTTRAEFGAFVPIIEEIKSEEELSYKLFLGGLHLKSDYTSDLNYVQAYEITDYFDFLLNQDDRETLVKSLSVELFELSHIFKMHDFDWIMVSGDRIELLPIITTAIIFGKPIIHLHGGEITEGAIDEQVRHMVTKSAHLHFTTCKEYRNNIKNMGEEMWRIHNVGALTIDNTVKRPLISLKDLCGDLSLNPEKSIILCTYHPVTLEFKISPETQIENVFNALETYNGQIVFTAPNIDPDYELILKIIKERTRSNPNIIYIPNLGVQRYLSLIPNCDFVIGNSSSGISEVPFFKVPTVNIGDRQKGRIRHRSIIDTDYSTESIVQGINTALSIEFKESLINMEYKFGDGHAAQRIIEIIKSLTINEKLLRKKLDISEVKND